MTKLGHIALEEARHPSGDLGLAIFFSERAKMRLEKVGDHVRVMMQRAPERFEVIRILWHAEAQVELVRPGEVGLRRVAVKLASKRLVAWTTSRSVVFDQACSRGFAYGEDA